MLVAVAATTLMTSCIKDKFDEPEQTPDIDPNLTVTHTIAQVKDMYSTDPVLVEEDVVISGVVISDDQAGNVYQTLVIQDETAGISFRIRRTDLFTDFPFGRKVYVKMKGLTIGAYRNLIQVGVGNDGQGGVNLIDAVFVDDYFVKGPRNQAVTPKVVSIDQLNNTYQNTLIQLEGVQFKAANAGKNTYADAVKKEYGNYDLENCNGKSVVVRTSGYSKFAADTLPTGSGKVVAIYQVFGTTGQLLINKVDDIQLKEDRCNGEVVDPEDPNDPEDPQDPTAPTEPGATAKLLFTGADFEDFDSFTSQLNNFGLQPYSGQAVGQGYNGGNALKIQGTVPDNNDFLFTLTNSKGAKFPEGVTKLSFWVKGTAGKSLSFNIYDNEGKITYYNIDALSSNKLIQSATNNQYGGIIDTKGQWVLVTLDLAGKGLNTSGSNANVIAVKVGRNTAYDLLIDNIVVW